MMVSELKRLRIASRITVIELAAHTGLPAAYLDQIEEESVVALDSDLARIESAIHFLSSEKKRR
ncbi:MAG: hypothetical protein PHN49_06305 [Candidatus Omnitrophica bacterium]|nr:hypothetical protein [Candidatus Omnitrophota bacterium]MDD5671230.1 hypothetical protein [Candidatus Omnitrophota bacterium]